MIRTFRPIYSISKIRKNMNYLKETICLTLPQIWQSRFWPSKQYASNHGPPSILRTCAYSARRILQPFFCKVHRSQLEQQTLSFVCILVMKFTLVVTVAAGKNDMSQSKFCQESNQTAPNHKKVSVLKFNKKTPLGARSVLASLSWKFEKLKSHKPDRIFRCVISSGRSLQQRNPLHTSY